jgi:transposase
MASPPRTAPRRPARAHSIHKPLGVIYPRVRAVGPERFGIVSVDCAKARSKWMLADFYGRVLVPPTVVEHTRKGLDDLVGAIREAAARAGIADLVVAVERTGRYHAPVQRACAAAGFEARLVHPLTSKQFRQPADPGNKTDDTDLSAIHRAAVNGFGLLAPPAEPAYARLQLTARHRRDLVEKAAALRCQAQEHLNMIMPGYAGLFDDAFEARSALPIARGLGSAAATLAAGLGGLAERLREAGVRPHRPTLEKVLAWAATAAAPADESSLHHRIMIELDDDRAAKRAAIAAAEADLAGILVGTPYVLLLAIPGINVVSAAELAGEMGPIKHYRSCRAITGRAGLYPARHQSDAVDRPDGRLIGRSNRRLRRAILTIADNLVEHNDHFRVKAAAWALEGKDPRDIRVKVAGRFCRIAYHIVAGGAAYRHPGGRGHDYVLRKLMRFGMDHGIDLREVMKLLEAATGQLPDVARGEEAEALRGEVDGLLKKRGFGVRALGEVLPEVLVKLGVELVQSPGSGEADRT